MKRIISIIMCMCMVIAVGCMTAGCGNDEVLKKIDDLQAALQTQSGKIDELQTQNSQLTDKLGEMQNQNSQFADKLEEMQTVLDGQGKAIQELKFKHGEAYPLEAAYNWGWLTQEELMSIAYYHNSGRIENREIMSESYVPMPKIPEALSVEMRVIIANAIKRDYNQSQKEENKIQGVGIRDYYGIYNGCAVVYALPAGGYGGLPIQIMTIGNVNFCHFYFPYQLLYVYKF